MGADLPTTKWPSVSVPAAMRPARMVLLNKPPPPPAPSMIVKDGEELILDLGDQAPSFGFILRDQEKTPIDLTTGSPAVTLSMSPAEGGAAVLTNVPASIVAGSDVGLVRFDWPLAASAAAGSFLAKFKLTQAGVTSHCPVNRSIVVRVVAP